jgi:hypothetical protein
MIDATQIHETLVSSISHGAPMLLDNISQNLAARPVPSGWALDVILRLDDAQSGFLRFLHTASDLRRQCVYFALTELDWDRPEVFANRIARASVASHQKQDAPLSVIASGLMGMRVRDIIHDVFGSEPKGLLGALSRCGHAPLDDFNYPLLRAIYDDPKNTARAALLRTVSEISDETLQVVWRLPPALLRKEVLNQIKMAADIKQYLPALELIERLHPTITEEDLAFSFSQMPKRASIGSWVRRWIEKAEFLPLSLPFAGDETLRPLVSGTDIKAVAHRYQNCLRHRIGDVALGRACYYEHAEGAIAELKAMSDGHWLLDGIYGPKNEHASPSIVCSVRNKLESAGVLVPVANVQGADHVAIANLLGLYEFAASPALSGGLARLEASGP